MNYAPVSLPQCTDRPSASKTETPQHRENDSELLVTASAAASCLFITVLIAVGVKSIYRGITIAPDVLQSRAEACQLSEVHHYGDSGAEFGKLQPEQSFPASLFARGDLNSEISYIP